MGRQTHWVNNDNLKVGFGKMDTDNTEGATRRTVGMRNELTIDVHFDDMDLQAGVVPSSNEMPIPAGAAILSATLRTEEDFLGGTSFIVGTKSLAGTAVAGTGLFIEVLLAEIDAAGKVVHGDGSLIGATVATTVDSYISISPTGTFTAGKASVVIEYIIPDA